MKNELDFYCQNGMSPERCLDAADADKALAHSMKVNILNDFNLYIKDGDCPCRAAWAAKYVNGLGRV